MNKISILRLPRHKVLMAIRDSGLTLASLSALFATVHPAQALNLYDGANNGNNLEINLTTTVSYTGQYRVNSPSAVLMGNSTVNDGDANFQHGLVGNLFSAVPVLDIRDGDYGAHFSGQLYLNTSYLGTNQNDLSPWSSALYVPKQNDFTSGTRNVDGQNAQLLDAFVFGQHAFEDGQTLQLKVGRQVLFWGQSLFFPTDGISGGQAPINIVSAQNIINPQAQQVFMPVGQAVVTYEPMPGTTFQAYYQFEWEHDFFQGEGAYFNSLNLIYAGGTTAILAPGLAAERVKDVDPEHQNGQFGLSYQQEISAWDLGIYGERFDAKAPEIGLDEGPGAGTALPHGFTQVGTYGLYYSRDIWLEGVSFSTNVGPANVAGELSFRQHQPLFPANGFFVAVDNTGNASSDPLYPVGNTWDAQLSSIYVSPGIPLDPGGVSFAGEIILNHLINVTKNRAALAPGSQATAGAFDFSITPTYNDVLPKLQITFPIGLTYNYLGRSAVDPALYHGTGTFDIGVTGTYDVNWAASLAYQDYLGRPNTVYNGLADRGYVSLNLQHTF